MNSDSDDDFKPPKTKKRAKMMKESSRFAEVTTDENLATASKGVIPRNTARNNRWALTAFLD